MTSPAAAREHELPRMVGVAEVVAMHGCHPRTAYKWLARAAGRKKGARGALAVRLELWLKFWEEENSRATTQQLADELADVVICVDLVAMQAGIDLGAAVVSKFNATSEKNSLQTRLLTSHRTAGGR